MKTKAAVRNMRLEDIDPACEEKYHGLKTKQDGPFLLASPANLPASHFDLEQLALKAHFYIDTDLCTPVPV